MNSSPLWSRSLEDQVGDIIFLALGGDDKDD
jgi:hypothetical protein